MKSSTQVSVSSALNHEFFARAEQILETARVARTADGTFEPPFALSDASDKTRYFLKTSTMRMVDVGPYAGRRVHLLDLMGNPRTRTTKSFAASMMVARGVEHINRTGERITIVTASSGNKANALRDAVLRAVEQRLVDPADLNIVVVVPKASSYKIWSSQLDLDPVLHARNPVAIFDSADSAAMKKCTLDGATSTRTRADRQIWYTLSLDNYRLADCIRAYAEDEALGPPAEPRLHVHAVSSAFGLLGHLLGCEALERDLEMVHYFLVQHLQTPDMVLDLRYGSFDHANIPSYTYDDADGLYHQADDPHFPYETFAVDECIDPTFYTRRPPTAESMSSHIRTYGGGGQVVSLRECMSRYAEVRSLLAPANVFLPADPRDLSEWSLVMAWTGLMNALDRDLLTATDVVVHGSGSFSANDFETMRSPLIEVGDDGDVASLIEQAAGH